jgi:hypothetical protein
MKGCFIVLSKLPDFSKMSHFTSMGKSLLPSTATNLFCPLLRQKQIPGSPKISSTAVTGGTTPTTPEKHCGIVRKHAKKIGANSP